MTNQRISLDPGVDGRQFRDSAFIIPAFRGGPLYAYEFMARQGSGLNAVEVQLSIYRYVWIQP